MRGHPKRPERHFAELSIWIVVLPSRTITSARLSRAIESGKWRAKHFEMFSRYSTAGEAKNPFRTATASRSANCASWPGCIWIWLARKRAVHRRAGERQREVELGRSAGTSLARSAGDRTNLQSFQREARSDLPGTRCASCPARFASG